MNTLVYILVGMLLLLTLHGWCAAIGFSVVLLRARREEVRRDELPRTAILMGLKGSDPDLLDGLQRLMRLDYPDYELHIVVDSETDPAWPVVHEAIAAAEADHVHVETYAPSAATGPVNSTNSKQMQLLQKLDDSFEVVAMADGDLIAHPDWLRDLVAPLLRDDKVAATFGNRWFMPEESHMGSLVRYTWGVAAAISMCFLSMPWGGCFAIKMSVVRKLNLIEKWSQFIAFDAATPGDLKRAGLRLRFIPHLMMPNYEECRLGFCHNFFQRQLTWTRLYHPGWRLVSGYAFFAGATQLGSTVAAVVAAAVGEYQLAAWLAGAVALNALGHPITDGHLTWRTNNRRSNAPAAETAVSATFIEPSRSRPIVAC